MMHDSSCGCPDCADFHPNRFDKVGNPETGRAKLGACDRHFRLFEGDRELVHPQDPWHSCINWKPIEAESSLAPKRIDFRTERTKPLAELTANDVPRGLDPDDVATDGAGAAQSAEPFSRKKIVEEFGEKLKAAHPELFPGRAGASTGAAKVSEAEDNLNSAVRLYRHRVHSEHCSCAACSWLLKVLVRKDYAHE